MKTQRIDLLEGKNDEERDWNRNKMAEGVTGVSCTMVTKVTNTSSDLCDVLIKDDERFSSVEFYANGAMNVFVRNILDTGHPVAFIQVRPE